MSKRIVVNADFIETRVAVQEATGGAEGLRQARAQHPRAIVLDLAMPEMSGFEVLRRLKEDPVTADIPVVVLTSKRLSQDEQKLLAPHATRIVSKATLSDSGDAESLLHALSAAGVTQDGDDG